MELNRIYNEDCLETMKRMKDKSVDLVLTDPPYGIPYNFYKHNGIKGNQVTFRNKYNNGGELGKKPNKQYFNEILRVSKSQVIWGGNYFSNYLPQNNCWLVWDKQTGAFSSSDCEIAWTSFNTAIRKYEYQWSGMMQKYRDGRKEQRLHPTQKPLELFRWVLQMFDGSIIYDPFIGSGTTAIACIKENRQWIGSEISIEYCDIANKRIQNELDQLKLFQ